MYLDNEKASLDKCNMQNFTVLPSAVFCIKILSIIIYSNWKPNFLAYVTFYLIIVIFMGIYILLIILIKYFGELAHKKSQNEKDNPLINSLVLVGALFTKALNHRNLGKDKEIR